MKFDVVVGNPPYQKNMHLKFLEVAVNTLKENGKIIWVHPARWMQDVTAPFKKNSDFNKYKDLPFTDFHVIYIDDAQKLFNVSLTTDLNISILDNSKKSILDENNIYELRNIPSSFKRFINDANKSITLKSVTEKNMIDGVRVRVKFMVPFIGANPPKDKNWDYRKNLYKMYDYDDIYENGYHYSGKYWTEVRQANQFTKSVGSVLPVSIKFNTIEEAKNFIDYTNTKIFQFFNYLTKTDVTVHLKYLPFMDNYKEPWTDAKLKEYFNISDEEMEFINKTMEIYM